MNPHRYHAGIAPPIIAAVSRHTVCQMAGQLRISAREIVEVLRADTDAEVVRSEELAVGILHEEIFNFLFEAFF